MVDPAPIASICEHLRGAYGFTMKSAANGSLFRVLPLRDPDQPRFWCIVVVRSQPGGEIDRSHPAWIGRRSLRREELAELMATIRDGLELWLADPAQQTLRDWLMVPAAGAEHLDVAPRPSPERSRGATGSPGAGEADVAHGSPHLGLPSDNAVAGAVA